MFVLTAAGTQLPAPASTHTENAFGQFAYEAPVIDGVIGGIEWVDAAVVTYSITGRTVTVYVMNDNRWLYLAVQLADSTPAALNDVLTVLFDNDHDGIGPEDGDDAVSLQASASVLSDLYYVTGAGFVEDATGGGGVDGSGRASGNSGTNFFELRHPLDDADDAHDFSLASGASVGFALIYMDEGLDVGSSHSLADYASWPHIVIAGPEVPVVLTAWAFTAPTIDGFVTPGEWSSASTRSFMMTRGSGFTGNLSVMNDATDLYILIAASDDDLDAGDSILVAFDNNNDGVARSAGDDALEVNGGGMFLDQFYTGASPPAVALDAANGGTSDGEGAAAASGGFNVFEIRHPLNSADDNHDVGLTSGVPVRFGIRYLDAGDGTFAWWPSYHSEAWFKISAASSTALPDFTVSVSPDTISIPRNGVGTSILSVQSFHGFSSTVTISATWVDTEPLGLTIAQIPPLTPPANSTAVGTLSVMTSAQASIGSFTLTLLAVSGGLSHSVNLTISVTEAAGDFSLALTPDTSVATGAQRAVTVSVTSMDNFSNAVMLSVNGTPSGVTIAFTPNPITPPVGGTAQSTMMIVASATATRGTFTLVVIGFDGGRSRNATFNLRISGCLIATAAFGSELSPEVQNLRDFRDGVVLQSYLGFNFMQAFDAWYYSFSPAVAREIDAREDFRFVAKVVLYPAIWSLEAAERAHGAVGFGGELAVFVAGLVASALLGLSYLTLPLSAALAFSKKLKRSSAVYLRIGAVALGSGLAAVILGLTFRYDMAAQLGTSLTVIVVFSSTPVGTLLVLRRLAYPSRN